VKADAAGFAAQQNNSVSDVASASESILVRAQIPLINPQNSNTSTTLNARAIESLPNPGGDMTYPLQFAAGALINTAGSSNDFIGGTNGFGNVQFNGLPPLSNGYIVDGLETNDPLTNLNSGLSTNLVRASLLRKRDSERSVTRLRRRPDCWESAWAGTAHPG
jgi:hypothetical protein